MSQRLALFLSLKVLLLSGCSVTQNLDPDTVQIIYPTQKPQAWQLDPSKAHRDIDLKALHYLYRGLMTLSEDLKVLPDTAEPPLIEGQTLKLRLQPNIVWSDNRPLTVEHYRDGLLRSLHQTPLTRAAKTFRSYLAESCQAQKKWDSCIQVEKNTLIINFRIAADLGLPSLTQAFSYPQRLDVINDQTEKPYLSPLTYPSTGPFSIKTYSPTTLDLHPIEAKLRPLRLNQVHPNQVKKESFTQGKIHIIEPPPLPLFNDPYWLKNLVGFSDFNLMGLVEFLQPRDRSLFIATSHERIRSDIQEKGLPLGPPPKPIQRMIEACVSQTPKILITSEEKRFKTPLQLFGPKNLLAFLVSESIQKQLYRNQIKKIKYVPLPLSNLHGYLVQRKPPHALYLFRSRTPSLIHIFELFYSKNPDFLAQKRHTFFDFLFQKYLHQAADKRAETLKDMMKLLCLEEHWMVPIFSIPVYAIIHPRLKLVKRDGLGTYKVWKK